MISKTKPSRGTKASKATTATFKFNPRACLLDCLADIELQHGHHHRTEQLAQPARSNHSRFSLSTGRLANESTHHPVRQPPQ
jgi:hypothetical protein